MADLLRIGTRGSRLALTQSEWAAGQLRERRPGLQCEIVIIQTTGDKLHAASLARIGGKGAWTKEIERALLDGEIDVAVHSLKDLPVAQPEGLKLGAIPIRETPEDCLVAPAPLDWKTLGPETPVATSSLRRQAQLLRINPNLTIMEIRGNVPTRIDKIMRGEAGALVLASAGLRRLGIAPPWMQLFDFDEILPAPGQGALGMQIREGDERTAELVATINDPETWAACVAERSFLEALGGGCRAPIGAYACSTGNGLKLIGVVASPDGKIFYRESIEGDQESAFELGKRLASVLSEQGAQALIEELEAQTAGEDAETVERLSAEISAKPLAGKKIVVTRDEDADGPLSSALRDLGADPLVCAVIQERPPEDSKPLESATKQIDSFDWVVFSSVRSVRALSMAGARLESANVRIACVGEKTAGAVLEISSRNADLIAVNPGAQGLLDEFRLIEDLTGAKVLFPRAENALPLLADGLAGLGCEVCDPIAYRTVCAQGSEAMAKRIIDGNLDAVTFASPSAVDAFVNVIGAEKAAGLSKELIFASVGPTTSAAMQARGMTVSIESPERTFEDLARALSRFFSKP